jgi:hypothetical protein
MFKSWFLVHPLWFALLVSHVFSFSTIQTIPKPKGFSSVIISPSFATNQVIVLSWGEKLIAREKPPWVHTFFIFDRICCRNLQI